MGSKPSSGINRSRGRRGNSSSSAEDTAAQRFIQNVENLQRELQSMDATDYTPFHRIDILRDRMNAQGMDNEDFDDVLRFMRDREYVSMTEMDKSTVDKKLWVKGFEDENGFTMGRIILNTPAPISSSSMQSTSSSKNPVSKTMTKKSPKTKSPPSTSATTFSSTPKN